MSRSLRRWWRESETWYLAVGLANLILGTSSVLIPLTVSRLLGLSVGSLGLLSSLVSLVGVIGSLVWGRLSDAAHRRRPFVVLSYAFVGASFIAMAFIYSFEQLALLNMLLNFFWVANASVTVLIVIENQEQGDWEKKIGHLNQIGALGWVLGLMLGSGMMAGGAGLVGEVTAVRGSFVLLGLLGAVSAVLAARWVPRKIGHPVERTFRGIILALGGSIVERVRFGPFHLYYRFNLRRFIAQLRSREGLRSGTRRFLGATLMAFIALGLFGIPLPLLLADRFGIASSHVFLYFAVQNAAVVVAYPLASRRIRSAGNRRVQMGALLIRLLLFAVAAVFLSVSRSIPSVFVLVLFFGLYGFTWSYFQLSGIALMSRLAKPENRGLALGLYNGLAGVGWILAGVGSGYLAEWAGYQAAFGAAAGFLVVTLLLLRYVPEPSEGADNGESRKDPETETVTPLDDRPRLAGAKPGG
jgi:MFS family permease